MIFMFWLHLLSLLQKQEAGGETFTDEHGLKQTTTKTQSVQLKECLKYEGVTYSPNWVVTYSNKHIFGQW